MNKGQDIAGHVFACKPIKEVQKTKCTSLLDIRKMKTEITVR